MAFAKEYTVLVEYLGLHDTVMETIFKKFLFFPYHGHITLNLILRTHFNAKQCVKYAHTSTFKNKTFSEIV